MYLPTSLEKVQFFTNCLIELEKKFRSYTFKQLMSISDLDESKDYPYNLNDKLNAMSIYTFSQLWSDTGCGWAEKGQIVGHAFSYSKNFVAVQNDLNIAFVFINKFAYTCETTPIFYDFLHKETLPGYADRKEKLKIIEF